MRVLYLYSIVYNESDTAFRVVEKKWGKKTRETNGAAFFLKKFELQLG